MNPKIKRVIEVILVIISVGTVFYGAYFLGHREAEKKYEEERRQAAAEKDILEDASSKSVDEIVPVEASITEEEPVSEEDILKKGDIAWQKPEILGDLGLTDKKYYNGCKAQECGEGNDYYSNGIKYVKSGQVTRGKYQGYDFIVVASEVFEGPGGSPNLFRLLKKDSSYIFLSRKGYGMDEYLIDLVRSVFSQGGSQKEFNNKIQVEELIYPEELYGLDERQRFLRDPYTDSFFNEAKLKKVFINEKYGQVWMTDSSKAQDKTHSAFELNSYFSSYGNQKEYHDIFDRGGFYLNAPDGTAVTYKMKMDIFEKTDPDERYSILNARWNDGSKNTKEYEKNPSGCGSGDYVYDETLNINPQNDLILIGKTDKGDDLYGYRDANSPGFSKLYNETYYVEKGKPKKSPEEFLKTHPKVFWQDYFGRILAFYSTEFISPAECGKPVIYLYPEKEEKVVVKVEPGAGLSYTDPEYKNGWQVLAKSNGELTNLEDGKNYPYLFWEGSSDVYYETPKLGFSVKDTDLDSFFNDKLSQLGLIDKEINDFKEFWIPKMRESAKPYYFVTFLSKNYIDQLAPLTVSPKPDTVIRLMMDYQPLDAPQKVSSFPIKKPEREGFTVVEWGGMLK